MKHLIFLVFSIISLSLFSQDIVINEFMSSNETVLQDVNGDYSDWVEIYNTTNTTVNLENYMLSDDAEISDKWQFPSVEISAKGFLLVFASGKNTVISGEIHTNFKLKQSGEFLYLSSPSGDLLSLINPVFVPADQSFGRITDGAEEMLLFPQSTPNSSNSEANMVYCSHTSGFYNHEFELKLISSNPDNQIRYSLNGETPKNNSKLYTQPILMSDITSNPNNFSNIPTVPTEGPYESGYYIWQ